MLLWGRICNPCYELQRMSRSTSNRELHKPPSCPPIAQIISHSCVFLPAFVRTAARAFSLRISRHRTSLRWTYIYWFYVVHLPCDPLVRLLSILSTKHVILPSCARRGTIISLENVEYLCSAAKVQAYKLCLKGRRGHETERSLLKI